MIFSVSAKNNYLCVASGNCRIKQTMNFNPRFPAVITCMLMLVVVVSSCGRSRADFTGYGLKSGDLAFRKGAGTKSRVVTTADKDGRYSHVGIVVETDSGFMVVHIAPGERVKGQKADTIKMETLEEYFAPHRAEKGEIARYGDGEAGRAAAGHALRLLEKKVLFDHDYDLEDSVRMYCTELIWYAFIRSGIDITEGRRTHIGGFGSFNGDHIFPSDIYVNGKIETVCDF